jgi:hypothetical protein
MLSLVNVHGYKLDVGPFRMSARYRPVDRAVLPLPEVMVDDLDEAASPSTLRPIFDAMWQAAGMRRSPNFDQNGTWTEPRDR